jgi:hypothetical protein
MIQNYVIPVGPMLALLYQFYPDLLNQLSHFYPGIHGEGPLAVG